MKVVLVPVGSAGDVHPYVGVGLALKARGHDVSVITNPYFAPLIERVGLRLVPLGTVEQYEAVTANPDLWSQIRGLQVIAEAVAQATPELYRAPPADPTELQGKTGQPRAALRRPQRGGVGESPDARLRPLAVRGQARPPDRGTSGLSARTTGRASPQAPAFALRSRGRWRRGECQSETSVQVQLAICSAPNPQVPQEINRLQTMIALDVEREMKAAV